MSQMIQKIKELQKNADNIRNVCILAHVDHGKTTLADYLIASNGIISTRNAGPMRYLDNRPDEQERKITMKASNISLYFESNGEEYLINLIDSPGHVDFSSETSAAVKLADGAIIVVDVVEGLCAQTRTTLQQAYNEKLKPILFLNKVDRLIQERNMSTTEAEEHLRRVLEQVNAVIGNIFASDVLLQEDLSKDNQESALESADDSSIYFNPTVGNVIFGSAQDGWGFSLNAFSSMFADKLSVPSDILNDAMWGDFYYNSKHKRCESGAYSKGKPTIFVQIVLENIWKLYNNIMHDDFDKISIYCEKLKLKYRPPKMSSANRKTILKNVFTEWLPLEKSIFERIIKHVTSPTEMYKSKLSKLISSDKFSSNVEFSEDDSSKVVVFIAKMVPISYRELMACDRALRDIEDEYEPDEQVLIAFCRIYCGVLRENSNVHLVKRDYNPKIRNKEELEPVDVKRLYLMMARNFEPLDEAHSGMIVGIWGLQKYVTKTATLSSSKSCPPFSGLDILAPPVLRVAVEAANIDDMPKLIKGLKLLNQVDSCVQIMIQETGEHVLCVLGEVHLEKCIRDLTQDYAKIKLNVSKPIVQFRETIVEPIQKSSDEDKSVTINARNNTCTIKIVASPLPQNIVKFLESNKEQLKIFASTMEGSSGIEVNKDLLDAFSTELKNSEIVQQFEMTDIWSIGPKKLSTCLLINKSKYIHHNLLSSETIDGLYDRAIINGFQSAIQAGPLCLEPMHGICFIMQEFQIDESIDKRDSSISGIIITSVKEACRIAFQKQPQRLVGPMYSLSIIANADVLGKCYAEISKRNGRILISDMIEGSGMWMLEAVIPVIESFDLANELRVKTSGLAMPQLSFSHWETIEQDPFWIPTTEEELEQFGDKADFENKAKSYMDSIRERKGLYVDKKLVEFAEKQRTLSKNK
ncbi:elongation factor-like GTPase 1 [Chironomus tepperi]|uniref:elongation factor-like GTPase 1 n=1 Tax=Chironomus tepperi TaxID=113505 RepID=UPI00391F2CF7